jgi:hypothetical protein
VPNGNYDVFIDNGNPVVSPVTLDINATVNNLTIDSDDSLAINGGKTLTLNGSALNNAGNITLSPTGAIAIGGTYLYLGGGGTLTMSGPNSSISGVTGSETLEIDNQITGTGTISGLNIINDSTITASGGTLTIQPTGEGYSDGGSGLQVNSGSTLILDGSKTPGTQFNVGANVSNGGTLDLIGNFFGSVSLNSTGNLTTFQFGTIPGACCTSNIFLSDNPNNLVVGGGTNSVIIVGAGTVDIPLIDTNTDGEIAANGVNPLIINGSLLDHSTAGLYATGTGGMIINGTLDVTAYGTFWVGPGSSLQVNGAMTNDRYGVVSGSITINGNYTQTGEGLLHEEIAGAGLGQFGQTEINGVADLAGTLDIDLIDGFTPSVGESFDIMSYDWRIGGFSNVDGLNIGDGLYFYLSYQPHDIMLTVGSPEPGTLLLLTLALTGLFAYTWWKRRVIPARPE